MWEAVGHSLLQLCIGGKICCLWGSPHVCAACVQGRTPLLGFACVSDTVLGLCGSLKGTPQDLGATDGACQKLWWGLQIRPYHTAIRPRAPCNWAVERSQRQLQGNRRQLEGNHRRLSRCVGHSLRAGMRERRGDKGAPCVWLKAHAPPCTLIQAQCRPSLPMHATGAVLQRPLC